MKVEDRFQFAKENKLCFNCLSSGHVSSRCKSSWTCNVPNCGKRHSKLLHSSRPVTVARVALMLIIIWSKMDLLMLILLRLVVPQGPEVEVSRSHCQLCQCR